LNNVTAHEDTLNRDIGTEQYQWPPLTHKDQKRAFLNIILIYNR